MLSAPNPDDPLANDVAELWKVGPEIFFSFFFLVKIFSPSDERSGSLKERPRMDPEVRYGGHLVSRETVRTEEGEETKS